MVKNTLQNIGTLSILKNPFLPLAAAG